MVAIEVVPLTQDPPVVASARIAVVPTHKVTDPGGMIGPGAVETVTTIEAEQMPTV